jgi:predicted Zn-dependent protease with MMP-like domain
MPINYYSIHRNKLKRKVVRLGKYLSPEQKRNLALKMYAAMPDGLKNDSQDMVVFTKGFRKDNLMEVISEKINL